jgi:transcriptional regulator with XRE-family HTH domain
MKANARKNICGSRVRNARIDRNWTQDDLSRALGKSCPVGRAGIAKIELGLRQVYDFESVRLAKVLRVDLKWLLTGKKT